MSNENHNNTGNWRSRLEALESLPGETVIDKNASWEKLHERLRGKKSGKKIIWYWSAAACLFLVLMIPVINSNKKDDRLVQIEKTQKQPGIKSSPTTLTDKKDPVTITSPVPLEKYQATTVTGKSIKKNEVVIPASEILKNRLYDSVSNNVFTKESVITALQPLDTSLSIAATPRINKKLKVVHINELGDPVEESPGMARNTDIHSFQLKLAGQEVYINSSVASRSGSFTILKSKTSPN